jgi:hypothetical protein
MTTQERITIVKKLAGKGMTMNKLTYKLGFTSLKGERRACQWLRRAHRRGVIHLANMGYFDGSSIVKFN